MRCNMEGYYVLCQLDVNQSQGNTSTVKTKNQTKSAMAQSFLNSKVEKSSRSILLQVKFMDI